MFPPPLLDYSLLNVADTEEGKEEGGYLIRQITTLCLLVVAVSLVISMAIDVLWMTFFWVI